MRQSFFYILIIFFTLSSCKKEQPYNRVELAFSTDTIFFDTVFTQVGSATRMLKVYNQTNQDIIIDRIYLAGGSGSDFRLNINGVPTNEAKNVFLPAHDSIYIFAEVTIHPNKGYLLREDSVIFIQADKIQSIKLIAIGWEVFLIKKLIITSDTLWSSDRPILIWDYVAIDRNATLAITEGTKVFLHRFAGIHVFGSLRVQGAPDSLITFTSDRLEDDYQDIPGQWGGIVLYPTAHDNNFSWCQIKNSIVGISVDSVLDTVVIDHSQIIHQSYANIFANNTNVNVYSSLLADAGWYNFAAINGGRYKILGSTVANYYTWGTIRTTPAVAITNYYIQNNQPIYVAPADITIINTIIYGSLDNELILSPAEPWQNFTYTISHCLIKTDQTYQTTASIINQNPLFSNISGFDFSLSSESPARDKADIDIINSLPAMLRFDINQADRLADGLPDIGAFEWQQQ